MQFEFSEEQKHIIYSENSKIFVDALPGTGKTTTLVGIAEENFLKEILYIVFSKELSKKSRNSFPINTEVRTINSFALKNMKEFVQNRIIVDDYKVIDIIEVLKEVDEIYKKDSFRATILSNQIINKINSFFNSKLSEKEFFIGNSYVDKMSYKFYLNIINLKYKITHGFILKYFADNFDFSKMTYDIVLLDEAQDLNPVMLLILEKIAAKKEVFVGDKRQSIFGFRELLNIFELNEDTELSYILSKSYRFGEKIGDFIQKSTKLAYNEDFKLISNENIESSIITNKSRNYGLYSAYISRTNNHLLEIAFEEALVGTNISIPFEWDEIKQMLMDIFYLKIGMKDKIKNNSLKHLSSFSMLEDAISEGYHIELSFLVKIINNYDLSIEEYIKILENHLSSPRYSELILITAHKSKGLEFLNVEIANDFKEYTSDETSVEEKNLIYVAMSRSIEELKLNEDLEKLI